MKKELSAGTAAEKRTAADNRTSASLEQNGMLAAVQSMSLDGKNKLVAVWMSKERTADMRTAKVLFWLDGKWNEIYEQYRIKEGFAAAQLRANTHVLSIVYGS